MKPLFLVMTLLLNFQVSLALKWFLSEFYYGNPWDFLTENFFKKLGDTCERNVDCIHIANSICIDGECRCQRDYYPETVIENVDGFEKQNSKVCRLGAGYKESCKKDSNLICRFPFICSPEGICDCPPGFLSNGTHCHRDCKPGYILVGSSELSGGGQCLPMRELDETCLENEQCTTRYARCIQDKCQCILDTVQRFKQCVLMKQYPIGDPIMENGNPLICDRYTLKCPAGNYCMFAQFFDQRGVCCPVLRMKCPVGTPLSYGCEDCPWETHYCFAHNIGTLHKQNMCCPNDCPRSQPIRYKDRCYPLAGHNGHCIVNKQCTSVQNSICMGPNEEEKICQCPADFVLFSGKCIRKSKLGGECETNADCFEGSNTICKEGLCRCKTGNIPEPLPYGWNETHAFTIEHCIAEPSCPSTKGLEKVGSDYEDCSEENARCSEGKYCRRWHVDPVKRRSYAACCPTPKLHVYEEICRKFGMTMLIENGLENSNVSPKRCILSLPLKPVDDRVFDLVPEANCPTDSTCIYNPFSVNEGICCKYATVSTTTNNPFFKFFDFDF